MKMILNDKIQQKSLYDLEGTVDEVIESLKKEEAWIKEHKPEYVNIKLSVEISGGFDGGRELWFVGDRPMTGEEITGEKREQEQRLKWRRDQYESLKKEFDQ